jgi:hypothetical protein
VSDWRTATSLLVLLGQYNTLFPGRDKSADGTIGDAAHLSRTSDHNPDANGIVHALDITHDPKHGLDIAVEAQKLADSRDSRIKYIIVNRKIMEPAKSGWVWKPYNLEDPHTGHMHISVNSVNADDPTSWDITKGEDMPTLATKEQVDQLFGAYTGRLANDADKKRWVGAPLDALVNWLYTLPEAQTWYKTVQTALKGKPLTPEQQAKINAAENLAASVKELLK